MTKKRCDRCGHVETGRRIERGGRPGSQLFWDCVFYYGHQDGAYHPDPPGWTCHWCAQRLDGYGKALR